MTNWYAEALKVLWDIETLASASESPRAMLVEIAKRNPKAVVDAWRRLHPEAQTPYAMGSLDPIIETCRKILADGRPIDAVKYWRSKTGVSLKEAKDEIDKLR